MSPRTGRPKVENPKNIVIRVRIDEETNNKLLEYCQQHKVTITEVVRTGIDKVIKEK